MGYLKGKSSLMIFDRHANLKYKYGNRKFWCRGYYVDTCGKNAKKIEEEKEKEEKILRDSGVTEDTIELYHVLITVDRLKEKVQNDVWIAVFMQLFLVALDKIIFRD